MIERQYKAKILIKNRNSKGEVLEELIEDKTYKIKSLFRLSNKEIRDFIIKNNYLTILILG